MQERFTTGGWKTSEVSRNGGKVKTKLFRSQLETDYSNHLSTEHLKSEHLIFEYFFVRFSNDLIP